MKRDIQAQQSSGNEHYNSVRIRKVKLDFFCPESSIRVCFDFCDNFCSNNLSSGPNTGTVDSPQSKYSYEAKQGKT